MRRWRRVSAELARHGVWSEALVTEGRGHAEQLVRERFENSAGTVVVVGGDGTIHEVVNALCAEDRLYDRVRLAVVPSGTGMDFIRNAGVSAGSRHAARRLLHARERRIDVGTAETHANIRRSFVNFAETGIGARVVAHEAQSQRELPGRASYVLSAIEAIREHFNNRVTVLVDGTMMYQGPAVSIVAANGAFLGGGMKIAPRALMWDGVLDAVVLGDFTRAELVANMWRVYPGVHTRLPKVMYRQGSTIEIASEPPSQLDLDGELYEFGTFRLTVRPKLLRFLG